MQPHVLATILLLLSISCGGMAPAKRATMPQAVGGVAEADGGGGAVYASNGATPGQTTSAAATPALKEELVIEAWLTVEVEDVNAAAAELRAEIERAGGRVTSEELGGAATSWSGRIAMRVPPAAAPGLFLFLDKLGNVTSKRVTASDVSKQLFDQELALQNLGQTMARLQQLLAREGLEMKDVLAIENELTRLRGEIERIKGEQRWLKDRVAYATIEVQLTRKAGVVLGPSAKFFPGGRFAALTLLDPGGAKRTRIGGGLTILFPRANPSDPVRGGFQFDAFQGPGDESTAFMATLGVATYSDFLGRGQRAFLNPYLGMRFGYARLHGSAFTFTGTAGLELFKHKYFMVDASIDLAGFVSDEFEGAIVTGAGAVFAF